MSDSNSSSSQSTQNNDSRAVLGEGALQARDGSSISVIQTPQGAFDLVGKTVEEFAGLAKFSGTTATDLFGKALDFARQSSDQASTAINMAGQYTRDAYAEAQGRGVNTDKLLFAAIAASVLVAVFALKARS